MKDIPADEFMKNDLHVQLLGKFAVSVNGIAILESPWKSHRGRNLFKLLALTPGHRLHRDQVIDILWPDSDLSAAANNMYQTLYLIRRGLESAGVGALVLEDGFVSLRGSAGQALLVDVEQFEAAALQTKDCQDPNVFRAALELYHGDLLPDDLYEEWTIQRRESLRQVYLNLLWDLARLHEAQQNYSAGIDALQQLLAVDRSHEEAHIGLMRLYALSGQRQQALRQYQTLGEVLKTELDIGPGNGAIQLYEDIQSGRFPSQQPTNSPLQPTTVTAKHNLPNLLTSFIGREKQISEVSQLVRDHRLVTLTGTGGTGKTRLALQVAQGLLANFADGVFLVDLASLSDPDLVPQACLQALNMLDEPGLSRLDRLVQYLKQKHLLLVLDNCEHVIAACTQLVDALAKSCPQLHILATSREILSVPGESPYRVPSLIISDTGAVHSLAVLAQVESVRLFSERAAQASPGFKLTAANAKTVAQIVRRLDGIPLAIELAAARIRVLTVEQIAVRLDDTFRLLTGGSRAVLPRQQTLKATMDWSYELLLPKERLLLQRLSVFAGGWLLEAAEQVCTNIEVKRNPAASAVENLGSHGEGSNYCGGDQIEYTEVVDLLTQLVDKSLVIVESKANETRYHLLEMIRQYARERLVESGCSQVARDRHLAFFADLTGQAEPHLRGKGQIEWLDRLEEELDNLRAAMEWSFGGQIVLGLKIAADLMWLWHIRGHLNEGTDWLNKLCAAEVQDRGTRPPEGFRAYQRARALRAFQYHASYSFILSNEDQYAILHESIDLLRKAGPPARRELGISLYYLFRLQESNDYPTPVSEELIEILHQENERFYLAEYYIQANQQANQKGDLDQARNWAEKSLAICKEIEDVDGMCFRLQLLGFFQLLAGDYKQAEILTRQGLETCHAGKNRWFEANGYVSLSRIALAQGNYEETARLMERALSRFRELDYQVGIAEGRWVLQQLAWSQGDHAEAIRLAMDTVKIFSEFDFVEIFAEITLGRAALSEGDLFRAEPRLKKALSMLDLDVGAYDKELFLLPWVALLSKQGKYWQAARMFGAIDELYRHTAPGLTPRERSEHEEALAVTRADLGEEAFSAAWQEGQALSLDQMIEEIKGKLS